MASKKELRALITLAGKIDPSLQAAMLKATKMNLNMVQNSKKSAGAMSSVWNIAKGVFTGNLMTRGLSMITDAIKTVTKQGVELASSLTEVQNVVDTAFGQSSKQVDQWASTALDKFGLSELQAKQFTGTLGAMLKSSGISSKYLVQMSQNLTALSGDFASFFNLDHEDAFNKIRSGIAGETEPLKQLGINMSVANLEAFALSKGITTAYKDMDQASQVMLRYAYLMEVSKDAQGDFAKTLDTSYANQKRLLTTNLSQMMANLASKSLPVLTKGIKLLNDYVGKIDVNKIGDFIAEKLGAAFDLVSRYGPMAIDAIKSLGGWVLDAFSKIKPGLSWFVTEALPAGIDTVSRFARFIIDNWSHIGPIIAGIATAVGGLAVKLLLIPKIISTYKAVSSTFSMVGTALTSPFGNVILVIGALVAAGIWLYNNWDWISKGIVGIWENHVMPFFAGIGEWFSGIWNGVVNGFKSAWNGITSWFTNLWDGIVGIFKGYINTYIKIFNFVIGGLNKIQFDVPDWVPLIGGKHIGINIPLLKEFAKGGFTDRPAIFGEAGLEAAIPIKYRNPRSISILNQTAKMIGAEATGGSPAISLTFNFNGPVSNKEEVTSGVQAAKEYILEVLEEYFDGRRRLEFG
ncbi:hypothetical protein [Clostridium thermosuccinogenes]|uniref:hypothetical protein n=1 Tax=Clostridium thermosuccinogenes TaxID=84032 RepID=UPI000CCC6470|nr:hypothetical protein [Pseudoclostridium thermosuccinogenes]PNT91291.1 hypothetical protein CDQ83_15935 [Pseudoclostridium thermosuccinogenes]